MYKILLASLLPGLSLAQTTPVSSAAPHSFRVGVGVGNGVELHGGYSQRRLLAYGRLRGKWWGPTNGPKANWLGDDINTRSWQAEAAALLGYPLPVGRALVYGAAGLAYVRGRQLGEYRYSIRRNGGLVTNAEHFYAYRDYQALGVPLEVGVLLPPLGPGQLRLGLAGQANLNPQHSVYCLLLTIWSGLKTIDKP